jgi:hypothetical protein
MDKAEAVCMRKYERASEEARENNISEMYCKIEDGF